MPFTITLIGSVLFFRQGWAAPQQPVLSDEENNEASMDFNPEFLHGNGIDVSRFSENNPIPPGKQKVTVLVNGETRRKMTVDFVLRQDKKSAEACLSFRQLKELGIRIKAEDGMDLDKCRFINEWVPWGKSEYNAGDFELNIKIPQIYINQLPRGYTDPSLWEAGETVGFLDYSANVFSMHNGGNNDARKNNYTGNLGLFAGVNIGQWRLRNRLNTNLSSQGPSSTRNLNAYAERDITRLKSQLVFGEKNTSGDIFDSYGLRGILLQSEERMLPDSLRNYSPVLRGVAETNAKVTVRQRGSIIYETVVPPGPFELGNIGTMGYGGDLEMIITEADGRIKRINIPYSAPPMLLHQGISHFALSVGQLKDEMVKKHPFIVQGSYRYGLSNLMTLFSGVQIGEKYQSVAAGNAINTPFGGISLSIIHARSELSDNKKSAGTSYQINYTKYISSLKTNLLIGAYRYSSGGYYSFREASMARNNVDQDNFRFIDFRQRQRISLTLSQQISENISLYLTGNQYSYWGNRSSLRQYTLTLNQQLKNFSYALTAMRTLNKDYKNENSVLLSINVPLGNDLINKKPVFNSLYSSVSHNNNGNTQFQTLLNGSQGDQNEFNYGIGGTMNHDTGNKANNMLTGNMSYQSGMGRFSATASVNNHSASQLSLSADGSVVAHPGGVTMGPALGDAPFAIIDAQGAKGARLLNGYGSRVDGFGYAIMPSLTPYRENTVSLNARGLPMDVDLIENEKVVVPRLGAAVPVKVKTITGHPMILTLKDNKGETLPIGTDLQNAKGISQGIVGQGGQAFVRGWQPGKEALFAMVNGKKMHCHALSSAEIKSTSKRGKIIQLEVICTQN
ncbi:hypothetical protein BL250_11840 [Erwinia sp. OLTSP20]|nr:hypothetical protein BK416_11370 [Erwinia sp. OLSSP12]PIJ82677.1 hypothetical protein BLD47_06135 [Erwinia sp. OLCASP19]PIJ83144.1 hypothetical protein BLD46_10230 [Erwinia sp. OLMTSP26]PIJ85310.1 hypothetical protein BLD49_10790 [Erwinia sp. OLMDSP33]PIJ89932.1 hypothetical protein BL249_14395 [Erwinia sp. OLFS4]PIJ91857.1 hypothetical protein BL250_11840 [Erwinia sp. OLTSP20]